MKRIICTIIVFLCLQEAFAAQNKVAILINQLGYELHANKTAVIKSNAPLEAAVGFQIEDVPGGHIVFSGTIGPFCQVTDWSSTDWYGVADFTSFDKPGTYQLSLTINGKKYKSYNIIIGDATLIKTILPAIVAFFRHQRADSPEELRADRHVLLYGSDKRVDLHGGWCDASGDVSKYFSHLAYTNFMLPQQTPMVTWAFINTTEQLPSLLNDNKSVDKYKEEALYGADYLLRSLSQEGYFYMTLFSYFKKNPEERRVVGLLANSQTTSDYQCAWREGAGIAIAALARIARWKQGRDFTSDQYLSGAEKAFAHAIMHSNQYADDGKDNIIDDYSALLGATELWLTAGKEIYKSEARKRAFSLCKRLSADGYFIADDGKRPFWHAADAGLPVVALVRYLDAESDDSCRNMVLETIKKNIDYTLKVTNNTINPFGYARQHFNFRNTVKEGFFIPHENESGWWWQGENARLASLVTAVILGGRLVYPSDNPWGVKKELLQFAYNQINWILGCNPYDMCMMYGYGRNNVPYMESMYGHGSGKGGISNGITGKDGNPDGSGIDFKVEDNGNEWRWSEQWIPHSSWFLQAVTALTAHAN